MIRVFSYNIHKGFGWTAKSLVAAPIKEAIHSAHPDLIFLQEVVGENAKHKARFKEWPELAQHEYFCAGDLCHARYGKNVSYPAGHHGNALISRYPVDFERNVDLTHFKRAPRGALHVRVNPPGRAPIHALSVHIGLVETERRAQTRRLCDYVELVAGDFNDWQRRVTPVFAERLGLQEAFLEFYGRHARTFPAPYPLLPLDRIYFRNLALQSCEHGSGQAWKGLSDHLPLLADFA